MEKHTPHCRLSIVKSLVSAGKVRATRAARTEARKLKIDEVDMLRIVMALEPSDFHKSMTTHTDHRVRQDVYCPYTYAGNIYLKLTVSDDVLIVSFKER